MGKVTVITSGKGGTGKSTVTAGLGAALVRRGNRVLVIDCDAGMRGIDLMLGVSGELVFDIADIVGGNCPPSSAIYPCKTVPELYILPAPQNVRDKVSPYIMRQLVRVLVKYYDHILIDCPAGIERGLRNVLNAGVDETILLVTPDDISIRSAERTVQVIESKIETRPHLIVNRLDETLIRCGEMLSALTAAQVLDLPLLGAIPEDPVVYRSLLRHQLFVRYDCEARNAVLRIASRISGYDLSVRAYGLKKRGIFRSNHSRPLKEVIPIDDH